MLKIVIEGYNLPGIRFDDLYTMDVKEPVYVGIQKGRETIELKLADLDEVIFECELKVTKSKDGSPNFLGPYSHGKPGDRHLYLGWFIGPDDVLEKRFRRTKIRLNELSWEAVERATSKDEPIKVRIDLTSDDGGPLCGRQTRFNTHWEMA